ncbi:MAG TPA: hypothetical protein VGX68_11135, partial [Thermoanaerobaculia bacterium]|nr:hypothetical protein [Thermoanaerobaculia bacterium]
MKRKNVALPLAILLLLSSFSDWRASAGTVSPASRAETTSTAEVPPAPEAPPARTAEEASIAAALPRVRRIGGAADASRAGGAGAFQLQLDISPDAVSRAFLVYELAGVPAWTAAVRSINGLPALGGFGAVASSGTALQIEEINPRWLREGLNQIVFAQAPEGETAAGDIDNVRERFTAGTTLPEGTLPYTVRNLRLVYLEGEVRPATPRLTLSHPLQGENDSQGAVLRGFVEPAGLPAGPAELFVDGVHVASGIGQPDGAFAVFVPRSAPTGEAWAVELEVIYPDGTRLHRTVPLKAQTTDD